MIDTPGLFSFLVVCAGFTSFITASIGAGGGIMLLAIMAQFVPPQAIIPVHGLVQLGSNAGRAAMSWRSIDWRVIGAFAPGAVAGALIGSFLLISLPPRTIYLTIAAFTLYLCWGPALPKLARGRIGTAAVGAGTTFLTLFVGATGPLVGAFIKQFHAERFATIATLAMAMTVQHTLKAAVFQATGFDLSDWIWLIAAMIASGAIGTWLGLLALKRLQNHHFQMAFKLMLSLLAVRLIWQSLQ